MDGRRPEVADDLLDLLIFQLQQLLLLLFFSLQLHQEFKLTLLLLLNLSSEDRPVVLTLLLVADGHMRSGQKRSGQKRSGHMRSGHSFVRRD